MKALLEWLEDRTGYRSLLRESLYEPIPGGARWRYVWGSTLVFTFVVQVITGVAMWTAYSPSAQTAWESVYYIQNHMAGGYLVRGIHHFAAQAMVVLLGIHLMQVIIDGAYKAPREINFWLGLILMQIVLGLSLTGYLLPWDQKGYYATKVATNIVAATPFVGQELQQIVQGGSEYGHHTLTRFFALHAGILPGLLVAFLVMHIAVFRRHGITVPNPHRAPTASFWPDQILRDSIACLAVLGIVTALAHYVGAPLHAPADPAKNFSAARPEWYFLFLFQFLKFEFVEHIGLAFGAIYVPGLLFLVLVLMPLIAKLKWGHRFNVGFSFVMLVAIVALTALAMQSDNESEDHQHALEIAEQEAQRVKELAEHEGIPPEGAVWLLRRDPKTHGPELYRRYCSTCHHYNGHDGTGKKPEGKPTAADLGNFGTRDWIKDVITNYSEHFAPFANDENHKELLEGEMADWVEQNQELFQDPAAEQSIDAVVEFLFAQSGRHPETVNQELVDQGEIIFNTGDEEEVVGNSTFEGYSTCATCHVLAPRGKEIAPGMAEQLSGPELTGYGSKAWMQSFIANPGSPIHYGESNHMPAFATQMTLEEMDMLVRWMMHDYHGYQEEQANASEEEESTEEDAD